MTGAPAIDLAAAARAAAIAEGFEPDFSGAARAEAQQLRDPAARPPEGVRDLRALLWSSIDNADTRDLDQLEVVEAMPDGAIRLRLAIADVDAAVPRDSAIDAHAATNTTSLYTGAVVFPMLPERLSTDLTSLREGVDRLAVVVELDVAEDGDATTREVYRALVHNRAQLVYEEVAAWLDGGPPPARIAGDRALADQLRLQDVAAARLRERRQQRGALELETIEARPVVTGGKVTSLALVQKNRARELIEDFMIAANVAVAQFLERQGFASIRRVVHTPERWSRLVSLAARHGGALPTRPDQRALAAFLHARRAAAPDDFAELSLSVVKLLGSGDYVVERPGQGGGGHFGLAVDDYGHATAPNRRFADLVTQRQVKAAIGACDRPYTDAELDAIAQRCTEREDAARKVERRMRKTVGVAVLADRAGDAFDAVVTGATKRGVFVRLLDPPVEGRVTEGEQGLDVGDRVRVRLLRTDASTGHVDFASVVPAPAAG